MEAAEVHDAVLMTYQPGNHAIRTPSHRFMRYRDGATELYDIVNDPIQRLNLAGKVEVAGRQQSLEALLNQRVQGELVVSENSDLGVKAEQRKAENTARRKAANEAKRKAEKAGDIKQ